MPLVALDRGERVVSIALAADEWEALRRRARAGAVTLPGCGSQAYLRRSRSGLPHFVHQPGAAKCAAHAEESPAHVRAKAAIVEAARRARWSAEPEVPGDGFLADVVASRGGRRVAFEVQLSPQAEVDYRDRTRVRADAGLEVVWLARIPAVRSKWASRPSILNPDPAMPVASIRDSDDGAFCVDAGGELDLRDFVTEYLAGGLTIRGSLTGRTATEVSMLRHQCWKCGRIATVWEVRGHSVEGACGVKHEDHATGTMWASTRAESEPAVKRAVAIRAGRLGWPAPAALSQRYTKTTNSTYEAFSCPTCSAVFGDWPLREAWMEAAYEDSAIVDERLERGASTVDRPHWCRDLGAGLCGGAGDGQTQPAQSPHPVRTESAIRQRGPSVACRK